MNFWGVLYAHVGDRCLTSYSTHYNQFGGRVDPLLPSDGSDTGLERDAWKGGNPQKNWLSSSLEEFTKVFFFQQFGRGSFEEKNLIHYARGVALYWVACQGLALRNWGKWISLWLSMQLGTSKNCSFKIGRCCLKQEGRKPFLPTRTGEVVIEWW